MLSCFNGNLSTLKSLDLSGNGLTAGSGGSFYGNLLIIELRNLFFSPSHIIFFSMRLFPSNMLYHAGFKVLSSRLKKLENLLLSRNHCNDSIFSSLTGFSSLKSLDLSHNQLTGSINSKLLSLYQENWGLYIYIYIYIYLIISFHLWRFISMELWSYP